MGGLAVLVGVLGGGWRYFQDRRDRLAWDKTRFIIELFRDFDSSTAYQRALRLIDQAWQTGDHKYLERVLSEPRRRSGRRSDDHHAIDRYLDFFDRLLTHVFITGTLSEPDISSFSGYLIQIAAIPSVRNYALNWGYEDVVRFGEQFDVQGADRKALADRLAT